MYTTSRVQQSCRVNQHLLSFSTILCHAMSYLLIYILFQLSIFLFENYIIPILQWITRNIFGKGVLTILMVSSKHMSISMLKWHKHNFLVSELVSGSSSQHSNVWFWMGPALSYVFGALWVLPLFWLSKPLNSLWFQVIIWTMKAYL